MFLAHKVDSSMSGKNEWSAKNAPMSGLLGVGSRFEGEIKFEGTLRIDGMMRGRITCKNERPSIVIISELAVVEADIIADVIIISGQIYGNIQAIERVEIHNPGRLEGTVYTCDLMVDDGALFQGECVMIRHLDHHEKRMLKFEGLQKMYDKKLLPEGKQRIISYVPDSIVKEEL
ncbi:MAG: cytoskeletal protein CcmA (bactofilin family) [bacterium]|jgi:cytoskeletal protein CcmA (bactofilin family)